MESILGSIKKSNPKLFVLLTSIIAMILLVNEVSSYFSRITNNFKLIIVSFILVYIFVKICISYKIWED